jgi:DNA-binding Xre family transcriptional regulator
LYYDTHRIAVTARPNTEGLRVTGVAEVTAALKRCLRSRGVTYAALARSLDLSEASVKRLFSAGGFTLARIEQICRVLDIDLYELARLARSAESTVSELTAAQEQSLAANPRLLLVFYLLLADWSSDEMVAEYNISKADCVKHMLELDRLRLIDLRPDNEVRLRTTRQVSWRRDGPMRRTYQSKVLSEFFDAEFDRAGESLRFEAKELSRASREVMRRKLDRLLQDFNELASIDAALKPSERDSIGLVIGLRPYVLSLFARLKRARKADD